MEKALLIHNHNSIVVLKETFQSILSERNTDMCVGRVLDASIEDNDLTYSFLGKW